MESEDQSIDPRIRGIADNKAILLEALDVNPVLLTELSAEEILDESTKQHITSNKKYGTNERFIDWLKTGSPQTIDIVLQKLRDDKQDHVANLIDGNEGERPLSAKAKQRIRKLTRWLTENMTTDNGLIDELLSRKAISSRDSEDINGRPTEYERVIELIDVILRRSDRTLKLFLKALVASNQIHVAQVVEKDEMIELCLPSTCKTTKRILQDSPKLDNDEELQLKMKSISSHNFALAVIKATNDIIIYVLCEDGEQRKLLEELFDSSQHREALLEELIKSSKSNTKARSLLESEVLQLIQDILPSVGHSGIVLQTGVYCGHKRELGKVSDSRSSSLEKSSLQPINLTPEQSLILSEQSHVLDLRSEEVVCDLASTSHNKSEKSLEARIDLGGEVDLCKTEGIKARNKTDNKEIAENTGRENSKVEEEKRQNHVDLAVDDKAGTDIDPVIAELQLKLKLVRKEMDRKISEVAWLQERRRKLEEENDDIRKDLAEVLELNAGDRDNVIVDLNRRVREVEKEKEELSKALKEALFAQHQTEEKFRDLRERSCKHGHNLPTASLLDIKKEMNDEANEGTALSELKEFSVLATEIYVNRNNLIPTLFLMLRKTKSPKEAIGVIAVFYLIFLQPLLIHVPVGIPDAISSLCFANISVIFLGSIVLALIGALIWDRTHLCMKSVLIVVFGLLWYMSSDIYGPGVGVGRYCEEDKCVYLFCWDYLSKNMRMGDEAYEQMPLHNNDEAGGLFTSPADFAVWNKYTSHRWDKVMYEYTQNGRFIRNVYTKPLLGTGPFHYLTEFKLNAGFFSAGHGSLFYNDPFLTLCMLDTNGNVIKSFGGKHGSPKGVPMILDADREGCIIVADKISKKGMTLCSDEQLMKQLKDKVRERSSVSEMCLYSPMNI